MGARTVSAKTLPNAAESATTSGGRGRRSSAAENRRSASSRSITSRNCSCSVIQKNIHFAARGIALAVLRHNDKAVRQRRRTEDRCAAHGYGFNLILNNSHSRVIDAANLRDELASQRQTHFAIGPIAG